MDLASHNGFFCIVPGNALVDNGRTMGPQENLLYILAVCPEMAASSRGFATHYGHRVNRYFGEWDTPNGHVSVGVSWDKIADRVTIGSQEFNRERGNVFVAVRHPSGRLSANQLPSLGPDADAKEALHHIQTHMTNNTLIASISLPERE